MIGSLRGQLVGATLSDGVIDVGGVGYRIVATPMTLQSLRESPGEVTVSVYTHVREDALMLYGFADDGERAVFEMLLSTHGVGPSLALAILGSLGATEVIRAVHEQDATAFEQVTGVGKKTAARLVLELQGSLGQGVQIEAGGVGSGMAGTRSDIAAALAELGYSSDEVRLALDALEGDESIEEGLRVALKALTRR